MKLFGVGAFAFICFLTSCYSKENSELNKQSKNEPLDEEKFAEHFSHIIYRWIKCTPRYPAKNWDDIHLNHFSDFAVLFKGCELEDYTLLMEQLKSRVVGISNEGVKNLYLMFSKEDNVAFEKGIVVYEKLADKKAESISRQILIRFYLDTFTKFKNPSRGLYWAHKDAEYGGGAGMLHLAYAYASGKGVMQNFEESIKWILIAQHTDDLGSGWAKEILKEIENSYTLNLVFTRIRPGALQKAEAWMKDHPNAFFVPPSKSSH